MYKFVLSWLHNSLVSLIKSHPVHFQKYTQGDMYHRFITKYPNLKDTVSQTMFDSLRPYWVHDAKSE